MNLTLSAFIGKDIFQGQFDMKKSVFSHQIINFSNHDSNDFYRFNLIFVEMVLMMKQP